MNIILSTEEVVRLSAKMKNKGKKIVLAGGCFDVLHPGHVIFLERAKKAGDCLIVLLESDEKVKELKGVDRPVHNQKMRARVLSALKSVDYVVMLSLMRKNNEYDELIKKIDPDVIAATQGDINIHHRRVAQLTGAKLEIVTNIIGNYSTSQILSHNKDL